MDTTALEGKIALVTGASSGIGASTAQLLANSGVTVIVGYFSGKKRAEKVLNSLPVGDHRTLKIDIANEASVKDAAALIGDLFGHLDILVNSGGATKSIAHEDLKKLDEKLFKLRDEQFRKRLLAEAPQVENNPFLRQAHARYHDMYVW